MKSIFFILLITPFFATAQISDAAVLNNCNKLFKSYLPKNYTIIDTAKGDFNEDKKTDIVLVIEAKEQSDKQRGVIILEGYNTTYKVNTIALKALRCKQCGGAFGDPYDGISFKENIVTLSDYGGSSWRWSESFVFRYQNKAWQLIGLSSMYFHVTGCDENCDVSMCGLIEKDINLSTQKAHYTTTKDDTCVIDKDEWKKIKVTQKTLLQNFNSEADYFDLYK
jgi:hypothetical protein